MITTKQMEELQEATKDLTRAFRRLVKASLEVGQAKGLDAYFHSAEFEDDAMNYCRELGWKEPE